MRLADPTAKALIFSQYVTTIEWLKVRLTAAGFGYRFISGSMPLKQRAKAISAFQNDPPTTGVCCCVAVACWWRLGQELVAVWCSVRIVVSAMLAAALRVMFAVL